ncbi:MAG TPA: NAD-dependent deacylase [Anaerolineae bacterium]|nr:NAD-dependent deacylase [Anaerolineae bacterium]
MTPDAIEQAAQILVHSSHAVVLTGAGHSTPSGIPDFRSPSSGLWEQADPMVVASLDGFRRNPKAFYDWIRPLAQKMAAAAPNPAHLALAELERMGIVKAVITQNIDQLHQRAGSTRVYELHGNVRGVTCTKCGASSPPDEAWRQVLAEGRVPLCSICGGVLKPDVVLFGELLPVQVLLEAQREVDRCDVLLVAGSSLEVYPAAELPARALRNGAAIIVVNYEPTHIDSQARVVLHQDVALALPGIARRVVEMTRKQ